MKPLKVGIPSDGFNVPFEEVLRDVYTLYRKKKRNLKNGIKVIFGLLTILSIALLINAYSTKHELELLKISTGVLLILTFLLPKLFVQISKTITVSFVFLGMVTNHQSFGVKNFIMRFSKIDGQFFRQSNFWISTKEDFKSKYLAKDKAKMKVSVENCDVILTSEGIEILCWRLIAENYRNSFPKLLKEITEVPWIHPSILKDRRKKKQAKVMCVIFSLTFLILLLLFPITDAFKESNWGMIVVYIMFYGTCGVYVPWIFLWPKKTSNEKV